MATSISAQDLRDGDLIFHTSQSRQSQAVRRVTRSPLTHVGLHILGAGAEKELETAVARLKLIPQIAQNPGLTAVPFQPAHTQ